MALTWGYSLIKSLTDMYHWIGYGFQVLESETGCTILGGGARGFSTRVHKQELHFTSHKTNNTFSRFSKIEVVHNVKNVMLVPLFLQNRVLRLYFSKFTRVLWTLWKTPFGYKFAREASCRWVWAYLSVKLHQKTWKWNWIKPPNAS